MTTALRSLLFVIALTAAVGAAAATKADARETVQAATSTNQAAPPATVVPPRVFLDCFECDLDYMRQNVDFVEYVRDRENADLHVLVMTLGTGSGGLSWTVRVLGLKRFQGQDRLLTFTTPPSATDDERRQEFARRFKIGLAGFAAETSAAPRLDLTWQPTAAAKETSKQHDPWNAWVFRTNVSGSVTGEEHQSSNAYRVSLAATRVTSNWKLNVSGSSNVNRNSFDLTDGRVVNSQTTNWNFSWLSVKSLGPRWSAGARGGASHSSFSNIERSYAIEPGIEFDVFPYADFQHRSLTIQYTAGTLRSVYLERTIYDKVNEMTPRHGANVSLGIREPWGALNLYSSVTQHLNNYSHYRTTSYGEADVRLFKGFAFNIFGEYDRSRDQISLRKGDASTEDVLLHLQQLPSTYGYFFSFGISYSFGSMFTGVLNPRFAGF